MEINSLTLIQLMKLRREVEEKIKQKVKDESAAADKAKSKG